MKELLKAVKQAEKELQDSRHVLKELNAQHDEALSKSKAARLNKAALLEEGGVSKVVSDLAHAAREADELAGYKGILEADVKAAETALAAAKRKLGTAQLDALVDKAGKVYGEALPHFDKIGEVADKIKAIWAEGKAVADGMPKDDADSAVKYVDGTANRLYQISHTADFLVKADTNYRAHLNR